MAGGDGATPNLAVVALDPSPVAAPGGRAPALRSGGRHQEVDTPGPGASPDRSRPRNAEQIDRRVRHQRVHSTREASVAPPLRHGPTPRGPNQLRIRPDTGGRAIDRSDRGERWRSAVSHRIEEHRQLIAELAKREELGSGERARLPRQSAPNPLTRRSRGGERVPGLAGRARGGVGKVDGEPTNVGTPLSHRQRPASHPIRTSPKEIS